MVQRLAAMCAKNQINYKPKTEAKLSTEYCELMDRFEFAKAFDYVWGRVQGLNKKIDDEKPWLMAKNGETEKLEACMNGLISELRAVADELSPFLPGTAKRIKEIFVGAIVPPETPLFPKSV